MAPRWVRWRAVNPSLPNGIELSRTETADLVRGSSELCLTGHSRLTFGDLIAGPSVEQRCLRAAQCVYAELGRVETSADDPLLHKSRILPMVSPREPSRRPANSAWPDFRPVILRYSSIANLVWSVNSNRTGRPVFLCRLVAQSIGIAARRHVLHMDGYDVAAAQFW
jgi:hypothetical protein